MSEANGTNPLEMSDEDFAKLNAPEATASGEAVVEDTTDAATDTETAGEGGEADASTAGTSEADAGDTDGTGTSTTTTDEPTKTGDVADDATSTTGEGTDSAAVVVDDKTKEAGAATTTDKVVEATGSTYTPPADDVAQGFYKQILGSPIRANGKDIQLKSPEEAVQLMQMGANYTRKLQELAPHRKLVMMLQNNGLDETKLSFLIDLDKKNPDAIKKLIKDSGIDPLEIDTSAELNYSSDNHTVSDREVEFNTAIADVADSATGKETLLAIDKWDDVSKNALWESPELVRTFHQQRELGVYDLITEEMDRRITLGQIPPNTPFLEAYKIVGDDLSKIVNANQGQSGTTTTKVAPVVVETRVAAPKATIQKDDKASAASPTTSTKAAKEAPKNPFAMADDEFMKQMDGRL